MGRKPLHSSQIKITIHDSVLCQKEKRYEVQYLLTDSISKQTGLTPGIKFKELKDPFPLLDEAAADIAESISSKNKKTKTSKSF